MTKEEFKIISSNLTEYSPNVPAWGVRQNFDDNGLVPLKQMTRLHTIEQLDKYMEEHGVPPNKYDYCHRRWFHTWCAWADEYIFYSLPNVRKNPNAYDSYWDIEFDNGEQYDIKSSKVLQRIVNKYPLNWILANPEIIIDSLHSNASSSRVSNQNRLYVLSYSCVNNEMQSIDRIACQWDFKAQVFKEIADEIDNMEVFEHNGNKIILCYLIENKDGSMRRFLYKKEN